MATNNPLLCPQGLVSEICLACNLVDLTLFLQGPFNITLSSDQKFVSSFHFSDARCVSPLQYCYAASSANHEDQRPGPKRSDPAFEDIRKIDVGRSIILKWISETWDVYRVHVAQNGL